MTTIAMITGANKGIGFETARLLGAAGVTVLVGARDEDRGRDAERALRDGGADARFVQLDVTDEKSVRRAAEWVDAEYGRLDILVNNAGIARGDGTDPDGPMAQMASIPYPSSKTALNMVTAMYAKELRDTPVKVNAANPGYCATDLNHHSGFRTPIQGAEVSVHLATLPGDGPTGLLYGHLWGHPDPDAHGALPW